MCPSTNRKPFYSNFISLIFCSIWQLLNLEPLKKIKKNNLMFFICSIVWPTIHHSFLIPLQKLPQIISAPLHPTLRRNTAYTWKLCGKFSCPAQVPPAYRGHLNHSVWGILPPHWILGTSSRWRMMSRFLCLHHCHFPQCSTIVL